MKKITLKRKKKVKPVVDTPEACLSRRYGPNKSFNELLACSANEILAMQNGMYEISGCWKDTVLYPIYCEPNSGNLKQDSTLLYFRNFSR